jgi:hypothetical protein
MPEEGASANVQLRSQDHLLDFEAITLAAQSHHPPDH